jgi:hypothetical protein
MDNHKFKFPTGTSIAANGYLVVVEDSNKFKSKFPTINNWIGLTGFNFSNSGDQVRLFNYNNSLYLSFYYQDIAPWTTLPDGQGYTLELTNNTANPNNPSSWFAGWRLTGKSLFNHHACSCGSNRKYNFLWRKQYRS